MSEVFELSVRGRLFRIQSPESEPPHAVLLAAHGFTGDERSMEIFTRRLRRVFWVIYPRAPHTLSSGGFSWIKAPHPAYQPFSIFEQEAQELNSCMDRLFVDLGINHLPVFTMGFSQGAALALVYSCLFSHPHERHALLAGYLPDGQQAQSMLLHQQSYFIAHGRRDTIIPVEQSRVIVKFLQDSGAETHYCESNSAHKLGLECLKLLENFFVDGYSASTVPG